MLLQSRVLPDPGSSASTASGTLIDGFVPLLLAGFLVLFSGGAKSATVEYVVVPGGNAVMTITGDIKKGLYDDVLSKIELRGKTFPDIVTIRSDGGDLREAMKVGALFRKSLTVVKPEPSPPSEDFLCNSACAVIVLSSRVYVQGQEKVGLHRPYFSPEQFGALSLDQARTEYAKLEQEFRGYLTSMGVKSSLIDKVMATSSKDMWYLTMDEFIELNGQPAYIQEWFGARCPVMSEHERNVYDAAQNYDSFMRHAEGCPGFFAGEIDYSRSACVWADYYQDLYRQGARFTAAQKEAVYEKAEQSHQCMRDAVETERQKVSASLSW